MGQFAESVTYDLFWRYLGLWYKLCGELQKKKVRHIQNITNTINKNHKENVAAS
jgi:hypothetical protein